MAYEQTGRICRLRHGLDAELHVRRLHGHEGMSQLFRFDLELVSPALDLDFAAIVGQVVTVEIDTDDEAEPLREITGVVARFRQGDYVDDGVLYHAELVPWLWLLTRRRDCRIFQMKTVQDIVREVLDNLGLPDFEFRLTETYHPLVNCVQYRETDFDFVSRLLEDAGIHYYFDHKDGKCVLVMADAPSQNAVCPGRDPLEFHPPESEARRRYPHVQTWHVEQLLQPARYTETDFNFMDPSTGLLVSAPSTRTAGAGDSLEFFDYPGGYVNHGDETEAKLEKGETVIRLRAEEGDARVVRADGESNCRQFRPGYHFVMSGHFREDWNQQWLLLEVRHDVIQRGSLRSGAPEEVRYENRVAAMPYEVPFRPARRTRKPRVDGPQTAIVSGKEGEEVYIDEYGRIKVQFLWDRYGEFDENSSCWIRVAQHMAGSGWGFIFHPRVGQEVVVDFLEGDPDRPLVVGRVYNAEQPIPYETPSQAGIKTRSTKEGTPDNFNEIRFEDLKGSEEIYVQAEKALRMHVKDSETETVGTGITTNAGASISRNAGANISRTADDNITDKAGKEVVVESGKDMKLKSSGSYQLLTNMGIQLKAMNYVGELIESGAKKAAEAIIKGGAAAAVTATFAGGQGAVTGSASDAASAAGGAAADGAAQTGNQALAALSPGIEAGAAELTQLSNQAADRAENLDGPVNDTISAADDLGQKIESGASPEAIAASFMAMAAAAAQAFGDAQKIVEGLLPQIPSITLWAMKDINAMALWSMELKAKVKDIKIEAENKNVEIKGKQELKLEAEKKDLSIKASTKKVLVTAKDAVEVKSEDKNVVIEAGKEKVMIKSPKQIFLKCGSASISLAKSGNIVIKGAKINIKGSSPVSIKGNPVKLN